MATYAVWQATVTDNYGNITSGATVTVRSESTGLLADIFETRLGTAKANPFTTGADGFAQFYAAPGLYRIEATSPEGTAEWRNVRLVEVATEAEALSGAPGVLPDAEGVKKFVNQFGLGTTSPAPFPGWDVEKPVGWYFTGNIQNFPGSPPEATGAHLIRADRGNIFTIYANSPDLKIYSGVGNTFTSAPPAWVEMHHTGNGATNAEALAGVNNTKWMSSLRTSEAIDAKLSTFTVANDSHNHSSATITSISPYVVGPAIAAIGIGEVGSYAWLRHTSIITSIIYGTNYSGSLLRTSGLNIFTIGDANQQASGVGYVVAGTWRAMGSCTYHNSSTTCASTIFKRIS